MPTYEELCRLSTMGACLLSSLISTIMHSRLLKQTALLSLAAAANAATHELIVGTFGTKALYTLEFDDEALTLDLVRNTSVPVAGSWVALSVSQPVIQPSSSNQY